MFALISSVHPPSVWLHKSSQVRPGYSSYLSQSPSTGAIGPDYSTYYSSAAPAKAVLNTLSDGLYLKRPIVISLEIDEFDDVIASFDEADISMSGDDFQDALQGLKDEIVDIYNYYKSESDLGPEPIRQLGILESYIERRNPTS